MTKLILNESAYGYNYGLYCKPASYVLDGRKPVENYSDTDNPDTDNEMTYTELAEDLQERFDRDYDTAIDLFKGSECRVIKQLSFLSYDCNIGRATVGNGIGYVVGWLEKQLAHAIVMAEYSLRYSMGVGVDFGYNLDLTLYATHPTKTGEMVVLSDSTLGLYTYDTEQAIKRAMLQAQVIQHSVAKAIGLPYMDTDCRVSHSGYVYLAKVDG